MLGISLTEKDIPTICYYINRNSEMRTEKIYGIIITHFRTLNLWYETNKKFTYKIQQRPFSLVGVYGYPISEKELQEDYEVALEVYEREMNKNKGGYK